MLGCVLHVAGETFDVHAFLAQSSLRPCQIQRHGGVRRRNGDYPLNVLSLNVSNADGKLSVEIVDALYFLAQHESELRRLQNFPGVTDLRLDFGYYPRDVVAQFEYFPPELLARVGSLGIGIELSLYHFAPESSVDR